MCTHQKEIVNPYTGRHLYVKCGHCEACQVEKAMHRVQKIRANRSDATEQVLITLTYSRECAPYVLRNEAYDFAHGKRLVLDVHRDCAFRYKRVDSSYDTQLVKIKGDNILGQVPFKKVVSFKGCKDLAHQYGHIGVCWFPDLQLFFKRLRINLDRSGYDFKFTSYQCSEYGVSSQRPHFHLLVDIPRGSYASFQVAVNESWPFSDLSRFPRSFERAFRASSYVASYINKPAGFPAFLNLYFQTKNSYSKGYGLADSRFSFTSILSMYRRGSLSYNRIIKKQGFDRSVTLPIPSYVINRFFPRFKGSSRFNLSSFLRYAERIVRNDYDKTYHGYDTLDISAFSVDNRIIYYSTDDIHKISVRLTNAWSRINLLYPQYYISSLVDYLTLYYKVWSLYSATVLRLHMENKDIPLPEKYDNLENIKCLMEHDKSRDFPVGFVLSDFTVTDPNLFKTVVMRTRSLTESFHDNLYKRKVNHRIYKAMLPVYEL